MSFLDPMSLKIEHSYSAHTAGLCDMEVVGHYIVTCGFSQQFGQLCVDDHIQVFDVRANRLLAPSAVTCGIHPMLLKGLTAFAPEVLAVSESGEFQVVNLRGLVTPTTMCVHHVGVDEAVVCTVDVSPSQQCLAFGDSAGVVHLWKAEGDAVLNHNALPSIFADGVESAPYLSLDDDASSVSLAAVPMSCCSNGRLLSDWPVANSKFKRRRNPRSLDPRLFSQMKVSQSVGFLPRPPNMKHNQVPYDLVGEDEPESPMMREENVLSSIPKKYRQVEMKYSKLGVEYFDFAYYNDTEFAGLEIHIPNAYCNCMLQMLYFLEPIRCGVQNHLCARDVCLACELGFLFRMLDRAKGRNCQATNFLRAFRTLKDVGPLGLLISCEEEELSANLGKLIQKWNRFVLQQLNQEMQQYPSIPLAENTPCDSMIEQLFGCQVKTHTCCQCGSKTERTSTELLFSLCYPHTAGSSQKRCSFGSVLEYSICKHQQTHAWCDNCGKYMSTTQQKALCTLPNVLSLNCQVDNEQDREFWKFQQTGGEGGGWVPLSMEVTISDDKALNIVEYRLNACTGSSKHSAASPQKTAMYDLQMVVGYVKEHWMGGSGNLIARIRVGSANHVRKGQEPKTQWYLFNDFVISPIEESSATVFPLEWLTPCILIYVQRGCEQHFDTTITVKCAEAVLIAETHGPRSVHSPATFAPLGITEHLEKGDLVGIDAEFVTVNQEEAEVKCDGTHTTLKPSQMSVARITVVRGKGPLEGTPFIDDYIESSEQVVDYLTEFSGINPGDLDVAVSSKHLTTLKATYLKLLYLLEVGVKFVGHGLKKDFRVINILIPPENVLDTVELFYLPKHRLISLRFLAWYFLGIRIQEDTHDSSEDARTALQLYHRYQELESEKKLTESLHRLYETGRNYNWVIPDKGEVSH